MSAAMFPGSVIPAKSSVGCVCAVVYRGGLSVIIVGITAPFRLRGDESEAAEMC